MRSRRRHRFSPGFSLTPVSEYLECKVLLSADVTALQGLASAPGDPAESDVLASLATTLVARAGESGGSDVQTAPVSAAGIADSSTSESVKSSGLHVTEEPAGLPAPGSQAAATALVPNRTSSVGASTASDLYPGDDGSAAPASGLSASDAAATMSNGSGASQPVQNGDSSPTDLNPFDDAGAAVSQAPKASNPSSTITASVAGIAAAGATSTGAGAIGPVAAQTGPSAPTVAATTGAANAGSTGSAGSNEGGREAADAPMVNSIAVTPDRGSRAAELAEASQAMNPAAMVSANGGLVSESSADAAAGVPRAGLSLDGSAARAGLAASFDGQGSLTRPADLLTEFLPFDRASVENAIDQFLERFEGMGGGLSTDLELATIVSAGSSLMAIAAVSTVMIVRRRGGAANRTAMEEGLEKALGRIFDLTLSWEPEHS